MSSCCKAHPLLPTSLSRPLSSQKLNHFNILLLGKSGVGKTTFINAFANYVKFNALSEINTRADVEVQIPCIFQMTDNSGQSHTFTLGSHLNTDGNESLQLTESQTKGCKSYDYHFDDLSLTLIDTPGILDTEGGVDKDKSNLQQTLQFLSQFESINAICILLRANEHRLDTMFRYSFLQFLNQFHRSALKNLVFVFTHSKESRFRSGNTDLAVKKMLKQIHGQDPTISFPPSEQNHFYFDSSSFEYIVAKEAMDFDEIEVLTYCQSWVKSKTEWGRLIKHVQQLPPHKMEETLAIQRAREIIERLLPLIRDIGKTILDNEELCTQKSEEVNDFEGTIEDLRKSMKLVQKKIVMEHFDAPRIVCGSPTCTKELMEGGITKTHYPQVCHVAEKHLLKTFFTNFSLREFFRDMSISSLIGFFFATPLDEMAFGGILGTGLGIGTLGIGGLVAGGAAAYWLARSDCPQCGCKLSKHFSTYYETREVEEEIEDETLKEKYNSKLSLQEAKTKFLTFLWDELAIQKDVIDRVNSVFAVFLKHRSITPYNDGYEEYLDYLVEIEKQEMNPNSWAKLDRLTAQKRSYQERKALIENSSVYDNESNIHWVDVDLPYIEGLLDNFKMLKIHGNMIRDAIEAKTKFQKDIPQQFNKASCEGSEALNEGSIAKVFSVNFFSWFGSR